MAFFNDAFYTGHDEGYGRCIPSTPRLPRAPRPPRAPASRVKGCHPRHIEYFSHEPFACDNIRNTTNERFHIKTCAKTRNLHTSFVGPKLPITLVINHVEMSQFGAAPRAAAAAGAPRASRSNFIITNCRIIHH